MSRGQATVPVDPTMGPVWWEDRGAQGCPERCRLGDGAVIPSAPPPGLAIRHYSTGVAWHTAFVEVSTPGTISDMARHLRNHRRPIRITTEAGDVQLLTIGHVAAAVGRTPWTIKHWHRLELLPPAPFVINAQRQNLRRRLYPEPFVRELARITARRYSGPRLDYNQWRSFQIEARAAYDRIVVPLTGGVMPPVEIELLGTPPGFTTGPNPPSTAACAQYRTSTDGQGVEMQPVTTS